MDFEKISRKYLIGVYCVIYLNFALVVEGWDREAAGD